LAKTTRPSREPAPSARTSATRGGLVYEKIRNEIRDRVLLPGDRLREADLAERLGVSRTPIREALKRLEAEGFIVFGPPRGFVIAHLSSTQVMEIYAVRELLEGGAARFACERATQLDIELLKHLIAKQTEVKSAEAARAYNLRLHEAIYNASHNEYLLKAMTVLQDAMALLGTTTYSMPGRIQTAWREHERLVECIIRRDADGAEKEARRHIQESSAVRLKMLFGDR
jgi:DNA-binding GntR family transcriptional regulator